MFQWLKTVPHISPAAEQRSLRAHLFEGICGHVFLVLVNGAFLVAFALSLGASNLVIGLLAAIPQFAQLCQVFGVWLVEKVRNRKALVVFPMALGRGVWLLLPFVPYVLPQHLHVPALLFAIFWHNALGSISTCAMNSWLRDFVPQHSMGQHMGRRMAWATAIAAIMFLGAGQGQEWMQARWPGEPALSYSIVFFIAGAFGVVCSLFSARITEPPMEAAGHHNFFRTLAQPLRTPAYRKLLAFTISWSFTITMAAAFFVVYMLERLHFSMPLIVGLSVFSQIMNVAFFGLWGKIADRFSNRSVLSVAGPLFVLSIFLFPFTTLPQPHAFSFAIVALVHFLTGISTAGVNLCAANIALQTAPQGKATAFLATNAVLCGLAAAIAPILGGLMADFFAAKEIAVTLSYITQEGSGVNIAVPALSLRGLDYVFFLAVGVGLLSLSRLRHIQESGTVKEREVLNQLYAEMRRGVGTISNVAGVRRLTRYNLMQVGRKK